MTDRELLEKAAKAAGIEYNEKLSMPHPVSGAFWGLWLVYHHEPTENARRYFNPLTDDGDALRLSVKLGMDVQQFQISERVEAWVHGWNEVTEEYGTDPYAATRRAIVRAAAAIGETL